MSSYYVYLDIEFSNLAEFWASRSLIWHQGHATSVQEEKVQALCTMMPPPPSSSPKGGRWGRRRRSKSRERRSGDYVPPNYVTTSAGAASSSLTTGISTLFRRASSTQEGSHHSVAPPRDDDDISVRSSTSSRIFSTADDSDDSYESRVQPEAPPIVVKRYRGFSTSISSLFLDESLVCASLACFGIVLSQRTEFLLHVRHRQRSSTVSKRRPSRILAYGLVVCLICMAATYVVFGFGSSSSNTSKYEQGGYNVVEDDGQVYRQQNDDDGRYVDDQVMNDDVNDDLNNDVVNNDDHQQNDDANNNNNRQLQQEHTNYCFMLRAHSDVVWKPFFTLVDHEWNRPPDAPRGLQEQTQTRDWGATVRLMLGMAFLALLGLVGRRRRLRTRYALLKARAQDDHLLHPGKMDSMESNYQGACAHTLCGCYPVDDSEEPAKPATSNASTQKQRKHQDCVSRGFICLLQTCCGSLCGCWMQCLSICALAQEAREMRLLVHPKFQRVDYCTHQPFSDYQGAVNDLRRAWLGKTRRKGGWWPHVQALSNLSRYIIGIFTSLVLIVTLTLLFNPRASFSWPDLIVLLATFVQAFLVLYIIHWIFHKSDLSLDAVVKYFCAGFCIAVPTGFFFEGLLVNTILAVTYSLYAVFEWIQGEGFVEWVVDHYRLLWIVGELVNAFVVAAVTEELCKYYTFRTIEHPDLVFLTGLNRNRQAESVEGGIAHYPFSSHSVSELNRSNSFDSVSSFRSTKSSATQKWIERVSTEEEFFEDDNDVRTHRQKAAALTTAMISVSVGLACAENFLYVFVLGGTGSDGSSNVKEEWIVLFFRSIFPVHALAAAMQSINMIRKFVECTDDGSHRIGVGRIVLPAILLHGSFDAVLLGINVYVESAWDKYLEENEGNVQDGAMAYNPVAVNLVAWLSITTIMLVGILWYYREHRRQKARLKIMEQEELNADGGAFPGSPGRGSTSGGEMELV
jgi:hypothetical protein